MSRPLTAIQVRVLGAVADEGPLTAGGVAYRLGIVVPSAAIALASLEDRRFVAVKHVGGCPAESAYLVTDPGKSALEQGLEPVEELNDFSQRRAQKANHARELLVDFARWYAEKFGPHADTPDEKAIDEYLREVDRDG